MKSQGPGRREESSRAGRIEEGVIALEHAEANSGGGLTFKGHLGYVYVRAGRSKEARPILTKLEELAREKYVPAYYFAIIWLGLEAFDQTLDWLRRAREERSGFLAFINVEPMFDRLRDDSRFAEFALSISPSG